MEGHPFNDLDNEQLEDTLIKNERTSTPGPGAASRARAAISSDKVDDLRAQLENSAGWLSEEGSGLIHLAVKEKASDCLQCLLLSEWKLPVDATNAKNLTPLFVAVSDEWLPGVKLLLQANADVVGAYKGQQRKKKARNSGETWIQTSTILQHAIQCTNLEILNAIVAAVRPITGYEQVINIRHWSSKMTPLLIAVSKCNLAFVELLLANGADVSLSDTKGQNVLHWAVANGAIDIIKTLIAKCPEEVRLLAMQRCRGPNQTTPLAFAVRRREVHCVAVLVEYFEESVSVRAEITSTGIYQSDKNLNVLHLAALKDSDPVMDIFAKRLYVRDVNNYKTLVNDRTELGFTPLHFALKYQRKEFAFALLASGADLSSEGKNRKTDMDVLINYLPNPTHFITHVMSRSVTKHHKHSWVTVNFTLFNPTDCCRADGSKDGHNGKHMVHKQMSGNNCRDTGPLPNAEFPGGQVTLNVDQDEGDHPGTAGNGGGEKRPFEGFKAHNHFGVVKELQKLGRALDHMKILEHVLVETFLHLHWKRIWAPFAVLTLLSVNFAVFLTVVAAPDAAGGNTALHVLNVLVFVSMLPLLVHEVQCLHSRGRPLLYWLQTALKLVCFSFTLGWFATGSHWLLVGAILLAWLQVGMLIFEIRQCHRLGRLLMHFLKKLLEYKEIVFGFIIVTLTVCVTVQIPFDVGLIVCKQGPELDIFSGLFTSMLLMSCVSFVCFLLVLVYACLTYQENYPPQVKYALIDLQITFLEVYEEFLLGKKPWYLAIGNRGIIYYANKGIGAALEFLASHRSKRGEPVALNECVAQCFRCLCSTLEVKDIKDMDFPADLQRDVTMKGTDFPADLQRDITLKGAENRERIKRHCKAAAKAAAKNREDRRVNERNKDNSYQIKKLEMLIQEMQRLLSKLQGNA